MSRLKYLLGSIILALPCWLNAQLTYNTNPDGSITITGYTSSGGVLNIPASINNRLVTSIGSYAFQYSSFTGITLPSSLQTIGDGAFDFCDNLTSITIPESVTSIGSGPFAYCGSLTNISVDSLNNYYASVDGILFGMFPFTQNLMSLIQYPAQQSGYIQTNYTVPNSVTSIGAFAFTSPSGLTNLVIGTNVTSIGTGAFSGNRAAITVDANNPAFSSTNGILFDKNQTILLFYPENDFGSYTLPASVTSIGDYAFDYCSLRSINLDNNLANIGNDAFFDCINLTSLVIPAGVTSLGSYVFAYSGLTNLTFLGNAPTVGPGVFLGIGSFPVYYSPGTDGWGTTFGGFPTVPKYPLDPFTYVTNNGSITITGYNGPGGAVIIPDTINGLPVTSIGQEAFYYCSSLTNVTIPNSVTNIGVWAFGYCTSLAGLTIPNSVTSIGDYIFYECGSLASVTLPNGVTSIGQGAFGICTGLTNITIPNSVTNIGPSAFESCIQLASITIPAGVNYIGFAAFIDCTSLTAITVDSNNSTYSSLNGVLFDKSQTSLIECPGGLAGNYDIPNGVASIGQYAFYYCESLTNITIPNSVTYIGPYSFVECIGLTNLTIPNSVTFIGYYAFVQCTGLTSITIPNSVTYIDYYAFGSCSNLMSVYFQGNAPNLGQYTNLVFQNDTNVTVYYLPGMTGWGASFGGAPTTLWNPQVQTGGAGFGVQNNKFGFNIAGTGGLVIIVEAATNFIHPVWIPVATNTLTGGSSNFSDLQWTNYPRRFYRLRSP